MWIFSTVIPASRQDVFNPIYVAASVPESAPDYHFSARFCLGIRPKFRSRSCPRIRPKWFALGPWSELISDTRCLILIAIPYLNIFGGLFGQTTFIFWRTFWRNFWRTFWAEHFVILFGYLGRRFIFRPMFEVESWTHLVPHEVVIHKWIFVSAYSSQGVISRSVTSLMLLYFGKCAIPILVCSRITCYKNLITTENVTLLSSLLTEQMSCQIKTWNCFFCLLFVFWRTPFLGNWEL